MSLGVINHGMSLSVLYLQSNLVEIELPSKFSLTTKTVRDYHYMCRFELENMSTYEILRALNLTQSIHSKIRYLVRSPWVRWP
jgi:hypothetical protein